MQPMCSFVPTWPIERQAWVAMKRAWARVRSVPHRMTFSRHRELKRYGNGRIPPVLGHIAMWVERVRRGGR